VALIAPLFFRGYWELPIVLTASALTLTWAIWREGVPGAPRRRRVAALAVVALTLAAFTGYYVQRGSRGSVATSRNFYGVLRVIDSSDERGPLRYLVNGRVLHGFQYLDAKLSRQPTTYYTPESGVGLALTQHPRRGAPDPAGRSLKVGVIGLGTGTLACYGQPGDTFRFYEINRDVIDSADRYFSFRRDSAARIETVLGDARIELERELKARQPQRFDVLAVDAFTSDSIPVHLLTRECVALYREHLAPDGLLLFHVTNHFLDLIPVVEAHARELGYQAAVIQSPRRQVGESECTWMVVTRNRDFLARDPVANRLAATVSSQKVLKPWTDDFVSLWQIMK